MKYEPLGVYRSAVAISFVVVGLLYLQWRIATLAPDAPIFAAILYGAEIYGFISAMLHLMMTWRLTVREPIPCQQGLSVDVFIPTYNESVDLVRKTVLAARHMEYPHETWLLDDGSRAEMKVLADRLGVHYLARSDNKHAKAGNLNHALAHSQGEFIVIFDADHAPQRNFITRTLGYFSDDKVAFVQTPQDFFNLDSYQHRWQEKKKELWTEQSLFFKVIQRGKDYWNAAFFCGSCAVVRRSAINMIGGFATETITEDIHTSIKLHKLGFRSIYHAESLAFGIAPSNVAPFLKQRIRWGQGAMQVLRIEKFLIASKLTLVQKLNYLASMLTYFDGWQKGVFYFSPAIVLIFGISPIKAGGLDFLKHFLPYYILSFVVFEEVGRGYGGILFIEQYNFARFAAFGWATLGLFVGKLRFKVTSKVRDQSTTSERILWPQMVVLLLNTAAVPFGLLISFSSNHLPADAVIFNIFWASINCALAVLVLNFTHKTQTFLRNEYRFPIPMPVILRDGNRQIYGTIDNISANGCRIYARIPVASAESHMLSGEIQLPSGLLPFKAQIMSKITGQLDGQIYIKAVGCRFLWEGIEHQDALELFLYGTDLQWKLLSIKENKPTPLQWLRRRISRGYQPLKLQAGERWASFVLVDETGNSGDEVLQFGLISLANIGMPKKMVTFQPLPIKSNIATRIFTRTEQVVMRAEIESGEALENSAGPIFLYHLSGCKITATLEQPDYSKEA